MALLGSMAAAHAAPPDIRVLIDVSGSMVKHDPGNLRIPALRLLTELLPQGTVAGVWLFDQSVTELIEPSPVDNAWKARARAAAAQVHSKGLHTDLEAALSVATEDWAPAAPPTDRHVIVITDGMVDVGQDRRANAASRERILNAGLAGLRAKGARINVVALSAETDRALLKVLTGSTDGWFEEVANASALQRVFLHLFEDAAPPDALPLTGNQFTVDTSVRELTVLVFRHTDALPLALTEPTGAVWTAQTAPDGVTWHNEADYDMVTITAPKAGSWSFNAAADPDNRALIVTDLALRVADLPAHTMPREPMSITAEVYEQGLPLKRPDFLQLVKADVSVEAQGESMLSELALDLDAGNFVGTATLPELPGDYEIIVRLNGGTFQREYHRKIKVSGPPFSFDATPTNTEADGRVIYLTITADGDAVDPATFGGLLELSTPNAPSHVLQLPPLDGNEITLELSAAYRGEYILKPWIFADTRAARTIRVNPDPISVYFSDGAVVAEPAQPPEPTPPPTTTELEFDWAQFATVVAVGNLGMGSVLGGLWAGLRRRGIPHRGTSL
jgi:von Willebrand factor type A domain